MKKILNAKVRTPVLILVSLLILEFTQTDSTLTMIQGKGIMYLKDEHIIKDIQVKEIKPFWIEYEKDGSLHDRTMEEIDRIEFPKAKPLPLKMIFEKNKPVLSANPAH